MPAPSPKKPTSRKSSLPAVQPFALRPSSIQGQGAFATRPIKKGERIIEYLGERITQDEADERYDDSAMARHHTFLFSVDDDTVIDAAREGNDARFINHSCAPNCQAFLEDERIYIYALRDIAVGEELSYDYGYERTEDMGPEEEALYVCRCGAPACRGTILAPLKKEEPKKKASAKKTSSSKKKSSKKAPSKAGGKRASKVRSGRGDKGRTRAARG
ncbi:SET domain-containing protein-lysine N-methyltransferase [Cystobacter fuscus]|uniref:SET domain-containing protein-lysine N-methyltransferase n=1 Tax=Cystobacter fuscus TaxID=43 RepID=A0A250JEV2_9BACT|nr:SET domain-containing protein-lysine N-methyltransferase [Cystobacter fuscus]ATB41931.1 SET domain-containing protein-lysine N-methyltransferase [Cystobacter fuscus]